MLSRYIRPGQQPQTSIPKESMSFVHQEDWFVEELTVEEHLHFAVALRDKSLKRAGNI